jgi:hypothetical protein
VYFPEVLTFNQLFLKLHWLFLSQLVISHTQPVHL